MGKPALSAGPSEQREPLPCAQSGAVRQASLHNWAATTPPAFSCRPVKRSSEVGKLPTPEKPKEKKVAEQRNLKGEPAIREVQTEAKMNTAYTFRANHFQMKVSASKLNNILDINDAVKRREKLAKRVKARPEAEDIPVGAKKQESELIVAKALQTNPRGKFDV